MIHFDRQQSTRRSENAWSPQPPSPTRATNPIKTLTPDDFMSAERLDSDRDVGSIAWYPFDWRTGGPNHAHSPLRKFIHPPSIMFLSLSRRPSVRQSCRISYNQIVFTDCLFRSTPRLDCLNPLASLVVACRLLTFNETNLDSPVNRAQAHNPFGKHHSQQLIAPENNVDVGAYFGSSPSPMFTRMMSPLELPALPSSVSPSASVVSLSPAAVPLPSPSPDETTELDSVN